MSYCCQRGGLGHWLLSSALAIGGVRQGEMEDRVAMAWAVALVREKGVEVEAPGYVSSL